MTAITSLEPLPVRDRESVMLSLIGKMARGEIMVSDLSDEADLRQLAYLASLSRYRVRQGGERLAAFYREALTRLGPLNGSAVAGSSDPLRDLLGAAFSLDAGKIRAEADLHLS